MPERKMTRLHMIEQKQVKIVFMFSFLFFLPFFLSYVLLGSSLALIYTMFKTMMVLFQGETNACKKR